MKLAAAVALLLGCSRPPPPGAVILVPGESIGGARLGMTRTAAEQVLPAPKSKHPVMGMGDQLAGTRYRCRGDTWLHVGNKDEVFVWLGQLKP